MSVRVCVPCIGQGEPGEAAVTNIPKASEAEHRWIAHGHQLRGRAGSSPGQQMGIQEASSVWPLLNSGVLSPTPSTRGETGAPSTEEPPCPAGIAGVSHCAHTSLPRTSHVTLTRGEGGRERLGGAKIPQGVGTAPSDRCGFYPPLPRGQQKTMGPGARKPEFKSWSGPPGCDHVIRNRPAEGLNLTLLSKPGRIATPPSLRNTPRFKGAKGRGADLKITMSSTSQCLF